jgi:hypothetical protein
LSWLEEEARRLTPGARFDKLASPAGRRHKANMRLILTSATLLLLAGCGANPTPVAAPIPVITERPQSGTLIGLDATALAARFGQPRFRVREGDGTKLQFAGGSCILDAYLYPAVSGGAGARVTHVDTRNREGRNVDQASCIGMIERR